MYWLVMGCRNEESALELGGSVFSMHQSDQFRKALPVQVSHSCAASSAVFDDAHRVSCAGLVPVMTLAAQTGLPELLADKISIPAPRIESGSANPAPKLSTAIAGMRLRAGRTGSGKGTGRMVAQAITTARAVGAIGAILVRGDSSYGTRAVVGACRRYGAQFSVVMGRNAAIDRAINAIDESAWAAVKYPGAVRDPDTGEWISDAEVAEIGYTAFAATKDRFTARLVVRRVKDARFRDTLFPVWRYHPFSTNTDLPTTHADITHRQHAIIEMVFADLIDGPLTHMPGSFTRLGVDGCRWRERCAVTRTIGVLEVPLSEMRTHLSDADQYRLVEECAG